MAVILKRGKLHNTIIEESFRKIKNDKFKDTRAACKYY